MSNKAVILGAIAAARESKISEQRRYREVITTALATPATAADLERLDELGIDGIFDHLHDQEWPPSSSDWLNHQGVQWDRVPRFNRLQQVADEDIRFALHFLGETSDQAARLKASATFYALVGCSGPNVDWQFAAWQHLALRRAMLNDMEPVPTSQLPATSTLPIKSSDSACTSTASMA